jgi:NAD(P)-dependent dehydrogenase (short-subunit alcohol dehydrogenase family)
MANTTFGPKGWTPERLGDLSGKTYIITGANAGAGFQAARILLKKNAKVVMLNRSPGKSEAAVADLKQEFGGQADVRLHPHGPGPFWTACAWLPKKF